MTENEMILNDRIEKIVTVINKYGIDNFYIAFSGGKDSTVLSTLIDLAISGNKIPRVYANTGIELNMIRDYVFKTAQHDDRVVIIKPKTPIKQMLEKEGYPFKSKGHANWVDKYQRIGKSTGVTQYLGERTDKEPWASQHSCPKLLKYQFTNENTLRISDKCCKRLKEDPLANWAKENNKPIGITGVMRDEGGRRENAKCLLMRGSNLKLFQPLYMCTKEWEMWFIKTFNVDLCDIYKPPYNFTRTGCKGCPFALKLQHELEVLKEYFPEEYKQCEYIWKPVYNEYRRLHYRLKGEEI